MELKIEKETLEKKNKLVDDAIVQLKKEFIGIDEQIDAIMNNVRTWFLFPQLQSSPCVVNVWGLTGIGKTSLLRRVTQLLDIEKDLVYFNFAAISESTSWEIENDIEEELDNQNSARFFMLDEFQYAATLDAHGEESNTKKALKPFWELLDSGRLHKRSSFWEVKEICKACMYMMKINAACPMEIANGVWINATECLSHFSRFEKDLFSQVFRYRTDNEFVNADEEYECDAPDVECHENRVAPTAVGGVYKGGMVRDEDEDFFFIRDGLLRRLAELYGKTNNEVCDAVDMRRKLESMDSYDICEFMTSVYEKSQKGYDLDFHNSIIFVIGNLDEAYTVAYNMDPDMSPNQFYNITKKISVVDIKKALQKRFRNEQIGRLGNTHIIYPSFDSDAFSKIIDLNLEAYRQKAKELCGLDVIFDRSIRKTIFKEGVFPTQGTRPIFSTINEIVKTKLPHIVRAVCEKNNENEATSIKYAYKNKKSVISILDKDGNVLDTCTFSDKLRLEKLRTSTKDEQQACTAVHESGHFVVYCYLNGRTPDKLVSRAAESGTAGFMASSVEDEEKTIGSTIDFMNQIKVGLGGYIAEGIIFGNEFRSSGASHDLSIVTQIASKMVRKWGMGGLPYVTTHLLKPDCDGMLINEDNQDYINSRIKIMIDEACEEVTNILTKPHIAKMLKTASKYLSEHSEMSKKMMNELLETARNEGEICINNERYYRNMVNNL